MRQSKPPPRSLGEYFRRGHSQSELARQLRCHPSHISMILRGQRDPSVKMARQLVRITGVPFEKLPRKRTQG